MKKLATWLGAMGVALTLALPALAAGFITNGLPPAGGTQYPTTLPLTGNETLPADTNLTQGLNPASEAITVNQVRSSVLGTAGGVSGFRNMLIGGDAGTNQWARGTSVGSITTTYLYTANNWFAWSGTSTTASVAQSTTAAELPPGFSMAFKVARTGAGVVQTCFAQEVESSTAIRAAGQTVELDFHAYSGAGFSAANGLLQAYILTGTGTDEGAQKMAWGLNGGGGGSTAWTGMTNALNSAAIGGANPTTATVNISTSTLGRYVAVANIPATATELGVALCWKPVGGSPSNDYVSFSGIQLAVNNNLSQYAGTLQATTNVPASAFERRPAEVEIALQQRFYYALTETAAVTPVASCGISTSSLALCLVSFPTTMRTVPTMTYATGFAANTTAAMTALTACTSLGTSTAVASTAANAQAVMVACGSSAAFGAAGITSFLYSNNGTGAIKASADL